MVCPEGFDDVDTLALHRGEMFCEMGYNDNAALEFMSAKFLSWVPNKMKAGEYIALPAIAANGSVAAGAGVWLMNWPPNTRSNVPQKQQAGCPEAQWTAETAVNVERWSRPGASLST